MKNPRLRTLTYLLCLSLSLLSVAVGLLLASCTSDVEEGDYLRLHIRANGNTAIEQSVKLAVRDAVVAYLTPAAGACDSKEDMQAYLTTRLDEVERIADQVLKSSGAPYRATARLCNEYFPTRTYADLTLPAGYYDALVLSLGSGEGDNWWCVAFPPLCFVAVDGDTDGVEYRSAIADWFRKNCQ
ncbi:MAG: stage II sporulation protein R [Clostridia bacterium]|nr:stage II sporulation protein R [Clostridia bacterium]